LPRPKPARQAARAGLGSNRETRAAKHDADFLSGIVSLRLLIYKHGQRRCLLGEMKYTIMKKSIFQVLRATSVLVFLVAICLFLRSLIFIMPGRHLPVTDKEHQAIGEVWIPGNSIEDLRMYGFFIVLSGLQMWTVFAVGREHDKPDA
jgi:hypothetical protein